ncbi:MAG: rhodanese-like domain-containing protein [Planctomycetes bacterium]|nr:rhodanese-like domain-containing protein [Planctomycetota bacterium]MBI3833249.1 rhodanese-like domain-containing protein [Planctomycetota bacterium]
MSNLKRTIIEGCILGALSLVLAFGVNAARGKGHVKVTKDYFAVPQIAESKPTVGANARSKEEPAAKGTSSQKVAENAPKPAAKHLEHSYQEMTVDQVLELLKNPSTAKGLNVIVDARDDQHFQEGHLPGAIQSFPYEFDRFRATVINRVNGAEKVVVYCGGGDCEDSIFMCRELVQAGVPEESIYLFAGGYEEWKSRKLPLESASE